MWNLELSWNYLIFTCRMQPASGDEIRKNWGLPDYSIRLHRLELLIFLLPVHKIVKQHSEVSWSCGSDEQVKMIICRQLAATPGEAGSVGICQRLDGPKQDVLDPGRTCKNIFSPGQT